MEAGLESCAREWARVASRINRLYNRAVRLQADAALAGDTRAFARAADVADELLLLRGDLEQWEEGECFDPIEFRSRLRRLERQLATIEARLKAAGG